jgi:Na+-transporting NADH:ubiquinone oxidoreductase subunit A
MSKTIKIRKGLDIRLKGEAEKVKVDAPVAKTFAIKPTDFHGLIPKMIKKVGEEVKAGTPIFFDKYRDQIQYVSPVSGTVKEVKRGAKRKILEVIIEADSTMTYEKAAVKPVASLSKDDAKEMLLKGGLWPMLKMRPLDIVADPKDEPKAIFISGFDSHPLSPDYDFLMHGKDAEFQAGISVLSKLTSGNVNLQLRGKTPADKAFSSVKDATINKVNGVHPAGNVGFQIHHINPISKGEIVWVVNAQDVAIIGKYALTGEFDATKYVALTGTGASNRKYYKTIIGAELSTIFNGNVSTEDTRLVSGNPLTGVQVEATDSYLGFYDYQLTALPEGNKYKFFLTEGWLGLGFSKFSASRAYPTWIMPKSKRYDLDTNLNGEERAFVVSEQYEKVFPMDIYPVHLLKSIIVNDIDAMENLGIYEVAPEDFALCEFVCTSKINSQSIVRKGLDVIREECM